MSEEQFDSEKIREQIAKEHKEMSGELDFQKVYGLINKTIRKYCDLREDYYNLLTLWVIGTWLHDQFPSFPFLFFNAMKGSGKSRLLKLLASMSKNGEVMASMSEAVLFRTAQFSSIFIDEFEGIGSKGSNTLRELLNSAYKQGTMVKRAFKKKTMQRDEIGIECFNVYCPIAMCNIYGMESVLADRCISLILEKSNNILVTKLIESFGQDPDIAEIKRLFSVVYVVRFSKTIYIKHWNDYILYKYIPNNNNINDINGLNGLNDKVNFEPEELDFFNKVDATNIDSRHLELFIPLFVLASSVSPSVFEETIETAKRIVDERKGEDVIENRDVSFLDFLSKYDGGIDFIPITDLVMKFKDYIHEEDDEGKSWVTTKWVGWALKRLALTIDKKRTGNGREVVINFAKAKEKIMILKPKDNGVTSK